MLKSTAPSIQHPSTQQRPLAAMSLDSKVYFKSRLAKLGISDLTAKFEANGWLTLGDFAVSANYAPGATDDSSFVKDVLVNNKHEWTLLKKMGINLKMK